MCTDLGIVTTVFLHTIIVSFTTDHTDSITNRYATCTTDRFTTITDQELLFTADVVKRLKETEVMRLRTEAIETSPKLTEMQFLEESFQILTILDVMIVIPIEVLKQ